MTVLADTSAWVEFDRATGSRTHLRLRELIQLGEVATTEPIQMEVLAGARSQTRELDLRRMLNGIAWLPCEPATDFDAAQRIYRTCRRGGITPRGLIDCLIAAIALRTQSAVLAHDADFARLAAVIDMRLDNGSLLP
ncbi:MAG TPA: PIN domain nuclease [Nocardioides sp.]